MAAGKYYWFTKAEEVRDKRSFYISVMELQDPKDDTMSLRRI
jgi:hypothetical protein